MAVFNGTGISESVTGGVTDDTVNGLGGDDTLDGGSGGIDTLNGGDGNDLLFIRTDDAGYGGIGDDILSVGGDLPAVLDGGLGIDTLRFESNYDISGLTLTSLEQLNTNSGILTASQLAGFSLVSGYNSATTTASLNLSQGGTAAITLSATLTSNFSITGSNDADILTFDPAYINIIYAYGFDGNDNITSASGNDSLRGDAGNDTLSGLDGNDSIDGGTGKDLMLGGNGNDTIIGGTGDTLNGGTGDDLFSISGDLPAVLTGGTNVDTLRLEGGYDISGATISGIEQLFLNGNVSLALNQLGAFAVVAGYAANYTTATVTLTEGGTQSVTLSATLTQSFSLTGSAEADIITFNPGFIASINAFVGAGNDNITAAAGADSLRGDTGDDTLSGLNGNDSIDGGSGIDGLFGGGNDDYLVVRLDDSAYGGTGNDLISITESLPGVLDGGFGQDTLRFESSYDISGSAILGIEQANLNGNVQMTAAQLDLFVKVAGYAANYTSASLTLTQGGTAGIDLSSTLTSGFGLTGSAQADLLTFAAAFASSITVYAGLGDDSITSANGSDSLRGDAGNDTLSGLNGNDSIDGGAGSDVLYGGGNNDFLVAATHDQIFGGANDDLISVQGDLPATLDGGIGNDILRFESSYDITGAVIVGIEQVNLNGAVQMTAAQLDLFNLVSGYAPGYTSATLYLTQGGIANVTLDTTLSTSFTLFGSATGDAITFAPAGVQPIVVYAGAGDDSISAAAGADSLRGDGGDDTLLGLGGNDSIDGGTGTDSLDGGIGDDYLIVRAFDRANGGTGNDLISITESLPGAIDGGTGSDTLRIESSYDISTATITGVEQLNLNGTVLLTAAQLGSFATVAGYAPTYTSASVQLTAGGAALVKLATTLSAGFTLTGSSQIDDIKFSSSYAAPISIYAGFGNDLIAGASGSDYLRGQQGSDLLSGLNGNDTIEGASGADTLIGGTGIDVLYGGTGRDIFQFATTSVSAPATPDRIMDFEAAGVGLGDLIDLAVIDADGALGAQDSFLFNFVGLAGLSLIDSGTDTLLRLNIDNDAAFEIVILIADGAVLAADYTAADFLL